MALADSRATETSVDSIVKELVNPVNGVVECARKGHVQAKK
jgi:hypothetical protein